MHRLDPGIGLVGRGLVALRAWIVEFSRCYERHTAVIRAWSEQQVQGPAMEELGVRAFSQLTSRLVGRIRKAAPGGPRPQLAAVALLALLERFTYYRVSRNLPMDDDEWLDTLAVMVHRGFFNGAPAPAAAKRRRRRS